VQNNKTVLFFIIKFFGTYLILFLIYSFYLSKNQQTSDIFACAPVTKTVADQTKSLLIFLGYSTEIEQDTKELSVNLFVENKFLARIVEGCNAISIIILFISFIIAFASDFKRTALFILFGSLIIYFTNITRIVIIVIAINKYPQYQNILHDIVFPSLIYGITFLLWFIWVQKFSKIKR
jgi:exosortase family protein XrtF